MERVQWCEDRGVRFLLAVYTETTSRQALEVLQMVVQILGTEPEGAFVVTDVRGAELDRAWVSSAKGATLTVFEPRRTRIALLGITDFHRLVLGGMQRIGKARGLRPVSSLGEAVDWFASC